MIDEGQIQALTTVVAELASAGQYEELLKIVGVPTLQQLNIVAARTRLCPLLITKDYRFLLAKDGPDKAPAEVEIAPIHKALYILFLRHTEGIEFKRLHDYRDELLEIYQKICNRSSMKVITDSIDRLVNPLDNSINEKCARIKAAFAVHMDTYQLSYYMISPHTVRHIEGSSRVWFERKKTITLPRDLVKTEGEL